MKISGGITEEGLVVGNAYDKYGARNPIVRRLMRGFESALMELVSLVAVNSIHEVGCGEGYWTLRWLEQGIAARGSDFSSKVIEIARANALEQKRSPDLFQARSIYDVAPQADAADLVVCCEVLEHLERPEDGLRALQTIASPYLIISVPREPLWSFMNMARGKYWSDLGNTPGHLQRWSQHGFVHLVSRYFSVQEIRAPVPWTMLLCRRSGVGG
ncbi:MAG: class I SAM-dependent methyltransferase [Pseudomonadota bacterium]|nr:class I SAM-dependent methyltransferase [Pseudomonadota bacterium]